MSEELTLVPITEEDGSIQGIDDKKEKGANKFALVKSAMEDKQIASIRARTPKQFIKTMEGRGGKPLSYIPVAIYIRKLNHTFGYGNWSFVITKSEVVSGHAIVQGVLSIPSLKAEYAQFGGHPVAMYGENSKKSGAVDMGDSLKAAASDCLKKCCSMMGMFADLYSPGDFVDIEPEEPKKQADEADEKTMKSLEMLIGKMDKKAITEFADKLKTSKKYAAAQKKKLLALADKRMKALPDGEPI